MIRPIVIAEYHQSKQSFFKVLVAFAVLALIVRLKMGSLGGLIAFVLLLPHVALTIGVGTFSEEFSKGQLRFLYAMPVGPVGVWCVKFVSGIVGLLLFTGVAAAMFLSYPDDDFNLVVEFLNAMQFSVVALVGVFVASCLHNYAVGFFVVTLCSSTKIGGVLSVLISFATLGAFWVLYDVLGWSLPIHGITAVLAAAAGSYFVGAFVMFLLRNPFDEAAWTRRLVGVAFFIVTFAAMLGAGGVASSRPAPDWKPDFSRVVAAHPSPDGERIFLVVQRRLFQTNGFVIRPDGTIERNLGPGVTAFPEQSLTWRLSARGPSVAFIEGASDWPDLVLNWEEPQERHIRLVHLDTGEIHRIPYDSRHSYVMWSSDGRALLGQTSRLENGKWSRRVFFQDATTGNVEEISSVEGAADYEFRPSGRILIRNYKQGDPGFFITVVERDGRRRRVLELSDEPEIVEVFPGEREAAFVRRIIDDENVGFELIRQGFESGEQVVLVDRAELPQATLQQAVRGETGGVHIDLSPSGRWLTCNASWGRIKDATSSFMLDLHADRRITLPPNEDDDESYEMTTLSPNETRLLRVRYFQATSSEALEDESSSQHTDISVLDLESDELQESFSFQIEKTVDVQWLNEGMLMYEAPNAADQPWYLGGSSLWTINLGEGTREKIVAQ